DRSGRKFWDPQAKSCTRFLARIAEEKFGWDPSPLRELIDWAEIIDGALFPSAQMAVALSDPPMQLMLLIEASKDPALLPRLIRELSQRPLSAVLREPWVTVPLQPLLERHHELVRLVTGRIQLDRGVATYDLADLGVENVNKFIAYAADASTLYTVSVSRGTNRRERKSTRLNSSHVAISYAVFCLKKKQTPSRCMPLALSVFLHCVVSLLLTLL